MIQDEVFICDYCCKDQGEFDVTSGNHPTCDQLFELEDIAEQLIKKIHSEKRLPDLMLAIAVFEKSYNQYLESRTVIPPID